MRVKCPACGEEFAVEESTRQRIVETIRNSEKELTYSELFDRVDIASKKDLQREAQGSGEGRADSQRTQNSRRGQAQKCYRFTVNRFARELLGIILLEVGHFI